VDPHAERTVVPRTYEDELHAKGLSRSCPRDLRHGIKHQHGPPFAMERPSRSPCGVENRFEESGSAPRASSCPPWNPPAPEGYPSGTRRRT